MLQFFEVQKVNTIFQKSVDRIRYANRRAHPELNQGPADLQSAALTTELYTHIMFHEPFIAIKGVGPCRKKGPAEI